MTRTGMRRCVLLAVLMAASRPAWMEAAPGSGTTTPAQLESALAPSLPFGTAFSADPLWDDGRAEVSLFAADEIRYGSPRPSRIAQIVVKEDLVPGSLVKSDDWRKPGLVPVLKLNWVLSVPTGVYSYEQMLSAFLRRSDLLLLRETLTHHEWCGNTWKALRPDARTARLEYRTYWEGESEGTATIPWGETTVAADTLPVLLRALPLDRKGEHGILLAPTLIGSRLGDPEPVSARLRVEPGAVLPPGAESAAAPASRVRATRIEVVSPAGTDRWWLETAFPHRVLRWERADGAVYRLISSRRLAYWRLNAPGDDQVLLAPPSFDPPLGGGGNGSR